MRCPEHEIAAFEAAIDFHERRVTSHTRVVVCDGHEIARAAGAVRSIGGWPSCTPAGIMEPVNRRAKLGLVLSTLVFVVLASTGSVVGLRAWRARQPFILEDDDASFTPGHFVVGGDVVAARACQAKHATNAGCDPPVAPRVRLYSLDARKVVGDLVDPDGMNVAHLALSRTGERLAALVETHAGERALRLWRVATHQILWTVDVGHATVESPCLVEFSRDDSLLWVVTSSGVDRVPVDTGIAVRQFENDASERSGVVLAGQQFIYGADRLAHTILIGSLADGSKVGTIMGTGDGFFRFSSSGPHCVKIPHVGAVSVYELPSGTMLSEIPSLEGTQQRDAAFSPDDQILAVASASETGNAIQFLDLSLRREIHVVRPAPRGACGWLEFATDRPALVAQYSGKIHVFPFTRR